MKTKSVSIDTLAGRTLVGDCFGESIITGEVYESSVFKGMWIAETEHGSLLLDPDNEVLVKE